MDDGTRVFVRGLCMLMANSMQSTLFCHIHNISVNGYKNVEDFLFTLIESLNNTMLAHRLQA